MEARCNLGEAAFGIVLFDIAQDTEHRVLLGRLKLQGIGMIQELSEKQPHRALQNTAAVGNLLNERIEQVFDQVLNRQDIRHMKQQVSRLVPAGQAGDDKASERGLLLAEEGKRTGKEGRAHDKVDRHICFPCRIDGLARMPAQHQKLARVQDERIPIDDMPRLPRAHIDHLDIIVGMLRECDKTGVRTDGDDPSGGKQLVTGNDIAGSVHIQAAVNLRLSGKDSSFLAGHRREFFQQHLIHA